MKPLTAEGWRI
jgi:hypothetical protein